MCSDLNMKGHGYYLKLPFDTRCTKVACAQNEGLDDCVLKFFRTRTQNLSQHEKLHMTVGNGWNADKGLCSVQVFLLSLQENESLNKRNEFSRSRQPHRGSIDSWCPYVTLEIGPPHTDSFYSATDD